MHKYHHSPEQKQQLLLEIQAIAMRSLAVEFVKPENDHQNIRHCAYLKGKLDAYKELFDDSFPDPEHSTIES